MPELYPKPGEIVVYKSGKGAFFATDPQLILRDRGALRLIPLPLPPPRAGEGLGWG